MYFPLPLSVFKMCMHANPRMPEKLPLTDLEKNISNARQKRLNRAMIFTLAFGHAHL
jgi:hypothetical protein